MSIFSELFSYLQMDSTHDVLYLSVATLLANCIVWLIWVRMRNNMKGGFSMNEHETKECTITLHISVRRGRSVHHRRVTLDTLESEKALQEIVDYYVNTTLETFGKKGGEE